jgi:hypothetical protein
VCARRSGNEEEHRLRHLFLFIGAEGKKPTVTRGPSALFTFAAKR